MVELGFCLVGYWEKALCSVCTCVFGAIHQVFHSHIPKLNTTILHHLLFCICVLYLNALSICLLCFSVL